MHRSIVYREVSELNPFAFPSETNSRFLLLIIAVAGSTLVLVDGSIGGVIGLGVIPSFLIAVTVTVFIFIWAWQQARQDANRKIKMLNLESFPPKGLNSDEDASLKRLADYVETIATTIPEIEEIAPKFVWDSMDHRPTGMAFGFGKQKIVLLRQGLHVAFTQLSKSNVFNAVLLHELGHLSNRDVSKTIFSITLGKAFSPTALIILGLFNIYVLLSLLGKLIAGRSLASVWKGFPVIIEINIKTFILLLLVEAIRSSILRVREYYADAYAKQCLGDSDSLIELFSKENSNSKKMKNNVHTTLSQARQIGLLKTALMIWDIVKQEFRNKVAPLHPTHRKRIATLINNHQLFELSYEVAFFSGLLSGLALNASFVISPATSQFGQIILNSITQGIKDSNNGVLVFISFIVVTGIFLVYSLSIALLIVTFGLAPVVSTVGLQLQSAAYFDKLNFDKLDEKKLTSLRKLVALSFVLGIGFVLGCLLVPIPKTFSLWKVPLLALISYVVGWASVFFFWLLPLKGLSERVYIMHNSDEIPKRKRRWLTILSALALLPIFAAMSVVQILSVRTLSPEVIAIDSIASWFVILGTLGLLLSGLVWVISWGIFSKKGWLGQSRLEVGQWALMPSPILLPSLPPIQPEIDSMDDTPPLSF
jgi:Zn-dependent protease with chaperone function